jgi:hypothetical protein
LPALADAIPSCIEAITIVVDPDAAGRKHAGQLAELIGTRGVEVHLNLLPEE